MCTLLSPCDHSCPFNLTCKPHRPHLHPLPFSYLVCNLTNISLVSLSHGVRTTPLGKCDFCPRLSRTIKDTLVHIELFLESTLQVLYNFLHKYFPFCKDVAKDFNANIKSLPNLLTASHFGFPYIAPPATPPPLPPSLRPILSSKLLFTADILPCEVLH